MDQARVVASLKINLRLAGQAVVNNHFQPIGSTKRRDRSRFTIEEESFDLLFIRDVHVAPKLFAKLAELDVARGRQYRKHEPVSSGEHDGLSDAIRRDAARCGTLRSRSRVWMLYHVVRDAAFPQILRESDCNPHGRTPHA